MTPQGALMFAVFASRQGARSAQLELSDMLRDGQQRLQRQTHSEDLTVNPAHGAWSQQHAQPDAEPSSAAVALVSSPAQLRAQLLRMGARRRTLQRLGLLLAGSLVVGFVLVGLAAMVLAATGALSQPLPSLSMPYVAAGVGVVLAAAVGGLVGGLVLTSRSQLAVRQLCDLLEHGHTLLLFCAPDPRLRGEPGGAGDLTERLRRRGAVQIGSYPHTKGHLAWIPS